MNFLIFWGSVNHNQITKHKTFHNIAINRSNAFAPLPNFKLFVWAPILTDGRFFNMCSDSCMNGWIFLTMWCTLPICTLSEECATGDLCCRTEFSGHEITHLQVSNPPQIPTKSDKIQQISKKFHMTVGAWLRPLRIKFIQLTVDGCHHPQNGKKCRMGVYGGSIGSTLAVVSGV